MRKEIIEFIKEFRNVKTENKIEYLENDLNKNESVIEKLKSEIEYDHFMVTALKIAQIPVTLFAFVGSLYVAKYCDLAANLLIAFLIPTLSYSLLELPKIIVKKDITRNEKKVDYYIDSNTFLKEELAKEKQKQKARVTCNNPTFKNKKIDTSSIDAYKTKYSNLAGVYDSIETVEAEEKPKRKSYEYKPLNK